VFHDGNTIFIQIPHAPFSKISAWKSSVCHIPEFYLGSTRTIQDTAVELATLCELCQLLGEAISSTFRTLPFLATGGSGDMFLIVVSHYKTVLAVAYMTFSAMLYLHLQQVFNNNYFVSVSLLVICTP
jgi:hypothetical protein